MSEIDVYKGSTLPAKVEYAKLLADSGLLPAAYRRQPSNVLWAMEYGGMLGLAPMAAITGVHVIDGKPTASAGLISALVRRAGHQLRIKGDSKSATCQIVRSDDPDFTFEVTWTLRKGAGDNPSAEEARLLGKDVWKNYAASMLKARAITQCARDACEEALYGLHYTPEELGAEVDEDGDVVAQGTAGTAGTAQKPAENTWLTAALKAAPEHATLEACGTVWRKSAEMVHDGSLTKADATRLQELLRKRMEELKAAAHVAAVAETVAAETPALDPDDSWMPAIDGLENAADAEALLDDLADQMGRGELEPGRASRIEAAIVARFPAPSGGEEKKEGAQAA